MAQAYRKRRKPMAQINVVPYIDVMLVLLVIFMVTAPLFNQGVSVDLPQAPSTPIKEFMEQNEPFIVSVDRRGDIFVNKSNTPDAALNLEQFQQLVPGMLAQEESRQAYVKGDNMVDYGRVVKVMVALQNAGVASVGLITQPDEEQ